MRGGIAAHRFMAMRASPPPAGGTNVYYGGGLFNCEFGRGIGWAMLWLFLVI